MGITLVMNERLHRVAYHDSRSIWVFDVKSNVGVFDCTMDIGQSRKSLI
jgi:hypothetical protein